MITRATKIQLVVFGIITVLGAAFVGGRYAKLDDLVVSRTYPVHVQLAQSGGIFSGADITWRGITIGKVGPMEFNKQGVQVTLDIEKDFDNIPADAHAVVANKSAVGEQYVDVQPQSKEGPYLKEGSRIPIDRTSVPIDAKTFLIDLDALVADVPPEDLNTVVTELGAAFENTGDDLGTILDNTSLFLDQAMANIDVTRALINDSHTVLSTQVASGGYIKSFSRDLALLSDTLATRDADLRALIESGDDVAKVNEIVAENSQSLSDIIHNLNGPVADLNTNKLGVQAVLAIFPYLLEGSFTVLEQDDTGEFMADFGIPGVGAGLGSTGMPVCHEGTYRPRRVATDVTDVAVTQEPDCTNEALVPRDDDKSDYLPRSAAGSDLAYLFGLG